MIYIYVIVFVCVCVCVCVCVSVGTCEFIVTFRRHGYSLEGHSSLYKCM